MARCLVAELMPTSLAPLRVIRDAVVSVCILAIVVAALAGGSHAASQSLINPGDLVIVDAGDPTKELSRGDGATAFVLRLSGESVCPGDSEHDQWRVQSFVVPSVIDPASLSYGVIGPEGKDQFALYGADWAASSYANVLTAANQAAGQPGRIQGLPPFSFAVAAAELITPGRYRIGIACTYFGETAAYWNAEVVVSASAAGSPAELSWRLANAPAQKSGDSTNRSVYLSLAGAAAIVALIVGISVTRRAHATSRSRSKEHQ